MSVPADLRSRPMGPDDAARWADLLAAAEEVDARGEHYDVDDCVEELADPELDLERDTVLVLDGAGAALGYQMLQPRLEGVGGPTVFAEGTVHPGHRRRGIGGALLAVARRRAEDMGAQLAMRVAEDAAGHIALAVRTGMTPVRWWSTLDRDLTEPVVPAPLPAGFAVRALGPEYDRDRWDEPLRLAHNSAFAEHWGSVPDTPEGWTHWRTGSRAFRPDCSAVVTLESGEVAGYLLGFCYDAETARTGRRDLYVGVIGTLAEHRGRGIAAALLAHVLQAARDHGYAQSSLMVDTQNPTGALGVYERAGYRLRRREVRYALPPPT